MKKRDVAKLTIQSMLEVSSVPLVKINADRLPAGFASGCLIHYNGRRLLLTVSHSAKNGPPLALSLGWDPTIRCVKLRPLDLNFLARITLGKDLSTQQSEEVDFAYADVSPEDIPRLEKIDPHTQKAIESRECLVWKEQALAEPVAEAFYGFAGHVKPSLEEHFLIAPDVVFCCTTLQVCFPLQFLDKVGDMYRFKLPIEHPGHEYFKGCSGAPIVDTNGNLVALVCGGTIKDSTISGISLHHYRFALDIHTGRVR